MILARLKSLSRKSSWQILNLSSITKQGATKRLLSFFAVAALTVASASDAEVWWPQFRGPNSDGHAEGPATPLEWSQRLADSQMARETKPPKLDYTMGLFTLSLLKLDAVGKNVWQRVDGIKSYPFGGTADEGVLLISEEFAAGGIWQVEPTSGAFVRLSWLGNYAHEGIGLDDLGNLYLGDENRTGAIYKAVPNDVSDLTKGGTLYYLVGTGTNGSGWKAVVNPANATPEALGGGAVLFDRPEDFDERNGRVYFAVTEPWSDRKSVV